MKHQLITIFLLISITIINCDEKIDSKQINKNEKRGAVGGIIYATKQSQYTETEQGDASPNKIYAKPSPNVAFSSNTVYSQPSQAVYTKAATSPPVYATQTAIQQAPQSIYTQPQIQYAQHIPQHAQLIQVQPVQPAYTLSHAPQQPQQIAYKIGYTQPIQHPQDAVQPVQYVQQTVPQQYLYQAAPVPAPVSVAQPVKIGYTQPIYQKQQVQPAYATYTSVPTNQHAEYATAPVKLTKVGYTTPTTISYTTPQQSHAPVAVHYSPASAVSQFSYVSPHVQYDSTGILTQTSYNSAKSTAPRQLNYSASQPIYTAIPAPQHLTYNANAPLTLTKVGYTSPIINYH